MDDPQIHGTIEALVAENTRFGNASRPAPRARTTDALGGPGQEGEPADGRGRFALASMCG